jgi:RimJ/RimL family protein N-acetyltransferase
MNLDLPGGVSVRPFRSEDADAVARHANDPGIGENIRDGFPSPYLLEHAEGFIAHVNGAERVTTFAVCVDGAAAGCLGFTFGDNVNRYSAEVGYWLGRAFWGRGIMSAALRAGSEAFFDAFEAHRIHAEPFAFNTASVRVLEKAGFEREGVMKRSAFKGGKLVDQWVYAKFRP